MPAERTASPVTVPPITRTRMARYAAAVADFNPIHFEDEFATAAGLPTVIVQGPLTAAMLLDAAVSGAPRRGSMRVRLKAPVFPGEELTLVPTATSTELLKPDGTVAVSAEIDID